MGELGALPVFKGVDVLDALAGEMDGGSIGAEEAIVSGEGCGAEPVELPGIVESLGEVLRAAEFVLRMDHGDAAVIFELKRALNWEGERGDAEGEVERGVIF